ncbi:MAG: helix-turn-helix domain-containing protein [Burkholderiaceae bacterium]|nr:helix-turn-helix domain-containing protein [Burkholderiaceae bacterium]
MQIKISTVTDIAALIRATRKASHMRIDDLAATAGLSKQFVSDVEMAKPTVQLARVLQLMNELGVHVYIDIPAAAESHVDKQREHVEIRSHHREATAQRRRLERTQHGSRTSI